MKSDFLLIVLICITCAISFGSAMGIISYADEGKSVNIVFTTDIHSHLDPFKVKSGADEIEAGGVAGIKTIFDQIKSNNKCTLFVDGGDFSMGTLYQSLFSTQAVELEMMSSMGYDAVTLGNHEFDYGAEGLADMLTAASDNAKRPSLVICNADWAVDNKYTNTLRPAVEKYGIKKYVMIKRNGINIAVLGVLGVDALECAPTCELTIYDPVESVKDTVDEIKENENADMIVCLSHSGVTLDNYETSEDEKLAKAVPELDVIISGHRHLILNEAIVIGNTAIVSSGCYASKIGSLKLSQTEDGRWKMEGYKLININSDIISDQNIENKLHEYKNMVEEKYLKQYGYNFNQIIAHNTINFENSDLLTIGDHIEYKLGNLLSDAIKYRCKTDIGVVPSGLVRDTFYKGNISVSDVFNIYSLGYGPDGTCGYPLVVVYLTGRELRTIAEVDASVGEMMNTARLYMSGFGFSYNPDRIILDKVTDSFIIDENHNKQKIEDDKLYSVGIDLYSCQMLSSVNSKSFGLLSVTAKDSDGKAITDFEECIIYENGKEVKAWAGIVDFLKNQKADGEGIAEIPEEYDTIMGRKIVKRDSSISAKLSNPGRPLVILASVFLFSIGAIVIIIVVFVKHKRKKNRLKTQI